MAAIGGGGDVTRRDVGYVHLFWQRAIVAMLALRAAAALTCRRAAGRETTWYVLSRGALLVSGWADTANPRVFDISSCWCSPCFWVLTGKRNGTEWDDDRYDNRKDEKFILFLLRSSYIIFGMKLHHNNLRKGTSAFNRIFYENIFNFVVIAKLNNSNSKNNMKFVRKIR